MCSAICLRCRFHFPDFRFHFHLRNNLVPRATKLAREIFLTKVEFIVFKLALLKPMSGEVNLENAPRKRVVCRLCRCCNKFVPAAHHPYDLFHFRYKNLISLFKS